MRTRKAIQLKWETYQELKKIGEFGETPNDVISELIKAYKGRTK